MSPWRNRRFAEQLARPVSRGEPRVPTLELLRIAGVRDGFLIADEVLGDVLRDYASGIIEDDELLFALEQQRTAYERYARQLRRCLEPMMPTA